MALIADGGFRNFPLFCRVVLPGMKEVDEICWSWGLLELSFFKI